MRRIFLALCFVVAASVVVLTQTEADIQNYFVGKKVIVKLDMPGTQEGVSVDVMANGVGRMDFSSYAKRLKAYGTAIYDGDSSMVTKVKVKGKNIEFQLDGGGFGTFGDDTTTTVGWTACEKSQREKDLEKKLDNETDRRRRDQIQDELSDLRWRREREDDRRRADARDASIGKADEVMANRARGGSRFNINFGVKPGPAELRPEAVMAALSEYVVFPWAQDDDSSRRHQNAGDDGARDVVRPGQSAGDLEKGMSREDVEVILGEPVSCKTVDEGTLQVEICVYQTKREKITTHFVDGTLVRFSSESR